MRRQLFVQLFIVVSMLGSLAAVPVAHLFGSERTQSCVLPSLHSHILVGTVNADALVNHLAASHGCFDQISTTTNTETVIASSEEGLIISVTEQTSFASQLTSLLGVPMLVSIVAFTMLIGLLIQPKQRNVQAPLGVLRAPQARPPIWA